MRLITRRPDLAIYRARLVARRTTDRRRDLRQRGRGAEIETIRPDGTDFRPLTNDGEEPVLLAGWALDRVCAPQTTDAAEATTGRRFGASSRRPTATGGAVSVWSPDLRRRTGLAAASGQRQVASSAGRGGSGPRAPQPATQLEAGATPKCPPACFSPPLLAGAFVVGSGRRPSIERPRVGRLLASGIPNHGRPRRNCVLPVPRENPHPVTGAPVAGHDCGHIRPAVAVQSANHEVINARVLK